MNERDPMPSNSNRTPPTIRTREDALLACRTALARWPSERDAIEHAQSALRHLCALGREESMSPEQMLAEVKRTLYDALPMHGHAAAEAELTRAGLIKFAIDAYYAARV